MSSFRIVLLVLLVSLPAGAGAFRWRAPAGLALPQAITPVKAGEFGWRQEGDVWLLDGGRPGLLEAQAWWKGNRPPRGEVVVLHLSYQDDFPHPVTAEVHSGLSTTNPYSQVHRFGGAGDGRWKEARVPVSSDFIFRYEPAGSIRFRITPAAGTTLKARSFRLIAPLPDEEERYNAETRVWVKREQERADVPARYWRLAQKPVLDADWSGRPLVPYARHWMDLVRPISAPGSGEAGATLRARLFRNEDEPVQLGIYANGRDLKNVRVTTGPVKDAAGAAVAEVIVRVAEYSKVKGHLIPGYFVEPFPQRLWPPYAFDVPAGRSHMVWLTVRTREAAARPGKYAATVRVQADGVSEVAIPLEVEILNARLLTMEEAQLKLGGCTTGLVPEFELEFLRDYNHNMVNIWYASVRPALSKNGDALGMDFRIMDDWMAAAKRAGISDLVYFLGGNPYGFPQTMNLPRTLAATMLSLDDAGWREFALRDPNEVPASVARLMVEWTRRFGAHARKQGWPNVVLTPFDEPAKYVQYRTGLGMMGFIRPQFKQQVRLLRQGDPKAQIYGSIHHYEGGIEFLEDVDIFCTNAVHENWNLPDEVRKAGKILWEYSSTQDRGLPANARYTFGYYFAGHDSRGSLVWAYNWGKRFDTIDGDNWMYAWNTPFDVIPAPYMEGLREAWDDRRLIETLKRRAAEKGVDISGFLGELFKEVAAARGRGGTDTVDDFWERAKNDRAMDEWKQRLVDKLLSLENPAALRGAAVPELRNAARAAR
jgi:hypothetical protein